MVSNLVKEYPAVVDDPLNAVGMKLALIKQLTARIDRQKFTRLVTIIFIFDDVCYSFHNITILAHLPYFVNAGLYQIHKHKRNIDTPTNRADIL